MGRDHGDAFLLFRPLQTQDDLYLRRLREISAEAPQGLGKGVVSGLNLDQQHRPAVAGQFL